MPEAVEDDVIMAYLDENWGRPGTESTNAVTVLEGPYRYRCSQYGYRCRHRQIRFSISGGFSHFFRSRRFGSVRLRAWSRICPVEFAPVSVRVR